MAAFEASYETDGRDEKPTLVTSGRPNFR
ncbi:uncharacterized protein G2W53_033992 [Senna tora]|uniref:Uncharacterized protein n=1 Tax=Senna tora TaxID=362788 RepID=A0A834T2E6_9FABA|nr:uncharacterized protein G2W53_033992 [Senna tora]